MEEKFIASDGKEFNNYDAYIYYEYYTLGRVDRIILDSHGYPLEDRELDYDEDFILVARNENDLYFLYDLCTYKSSGMPRELGIWYASWNAEFEYFIWYNLESIYKRLSEFMEDASDL